MKSTKIKLISILSILMLTLVACGGMNDNEQGQGQRGEDTNNIQPTRYNADDTDKRDTNLDRDPRNEARDNRGMNREDRDRTRENDQYDIADKAADRITDDVAGIDRAYVLTTKNNAYVAAGLNDGKNRKGKDNRDNNKNMNNRGNNAGDSDQELTDDVKKQITDIVQSVDNDIDNVYVSTNPDFFDLTNKYVDDVNAGKPVRGFFDQFGNMVERLFPQNKR